VRYILNDEGTLREWASQYLSGTAGNSGKAARQSDEKTASEMDTKGDKVIREDLTLCPEPSMLEKDDRNENRTGVGREQAGPERNAR